MIDGGMHVHPPRMFRMRDFNRTSKYDEELENAVDFDFFLKLPRFLTDIITNEGYIFTENMVRILRYSDKQADRKHTY